MTVDDSRRAARRQAVFLLYQRDVTGTPIEELIEAVERDRGAAIDPFTRDLVDGVVAGEPEIDQVVGGAASGWSVDRIAPLERAILRVAAYEIRERADVPDAVAIDEAVGFAKRYCQADAGGFVNGILGAIARAGVAR